MGSASAPDGGDNSIYTIDAAKKMKYDELFPVEAKKFGYDPKAKANSVEQALDDRVKKKADRYFSLLAVILTFIHWEISKLHIGTVLPREVGDGGKLKDPGFCIPALMCKPSYGNVNELNRIELKQAADHRIHFTCM
nr:hypothetical protein DM860_017167 [Ipomoea batatas]